MDIELRSITCGYPGHDVLTDLSLQFSTGEISCILGPNGVGKTTLFRTLLGFQSPRRGTILLNGQDIVTCTPRQIAQCIAYVPQTKNHSYQHTVLDVVLMGRALYIPRFGHPSQEDYDIARETLRQLGIVHLAEKAYAKLSGGEQQIVLIARALVQQSGFILMDEPASNLDFRNTQYVLDVLRDLVDVKEIGVIMSTHSPDHAFYCGDRAVLISRDKRVRAGYVDNVMTQSSLSEVYGTQVALLHGEDEGGKALRSCCFCRGGLNVTRKEQVC